MKKYYVIATMALVAMGTYSCTKTPTSPTSGKTFYLDLPAKTDSFYSFGPDNSKTTIGRVLFYDAHLSVNNAVACGSCHKQILGFADNAALSTGYENRLTRRNTPAIQNILSTGISFENQTAGNGSSFELFWDGRENNLINMMLRPVSNHVEMGLEDISVLPGKLAGLSYYAPLFKAAYGDTAITTDRISQCLAMFSGAISSQHSRFDEFQNGNTTVFTAQEQQGMNLFITKYNCASCHHVTMPGYGGGSMGADFKDIGLDNNYTDLGKGAITGFATDNGTFKVPSLRNVGLTAPYMHDGRFATLGDVIDHYSHGINASPNLDGNLKTNGQPMKMNISSDEKAALVAFLNTFTDYNIAVDPKFSNPFKVK